MHPLEGKWFWHTLFVVNDEIFSLAFHLCLAFHITNIFQKINLYTYTPL